MKAPAIDPQAPRRVLVVEDEPKLRQAMDRALHDMGFAAVSVASGESGLERMDDEPRDLILLDLNLPGMSGMEFFEIVRQRWPDTGVVILTGYGDLDAAKRAIQLDVVDFITKPFMLGEVEQALERAWRRKLEDAMSHGRPLPVKPREQMASTETDDQSKAVKTLEDYEREHIIEALRRNDGNRTRTAADLGISLRKLYYRLSMWQIDDKY